MSVYSLPFFTASAITLALALFTFIKRKSYTRITRPFLASLLSVSLWLFTRGLVFSAEGENLALVLARFGYVGVIYIPIAFYLVALGVSGIKEKKAIRAAVTSIGIILSLLCIFTPLLIKGFHKIRWGPTFTAGALHPLFLLTFSAIYFRSLYILYRCGYRRKKLVSVYSLKAKYIFWAIGIGGFGAVDFLIDYGIDIYPFGFLFALFGIIIISYAVFKHKLVDVDVVIQKSLVYSILIGLLTTVYVLGVLVLERTFHDIFGYQSLLLSIMFAALIAIFIQPIKNKIQYFIDKVFFRGSQEALAKKLKALEEEMRKREKLKAVATLAAGMAHEIKNPLSSIKTFAEYLPQKYQDKEFREKFQRILVQEVAKINDIVGQMLDFAKPKAPSLKRADINELLDDTLSLLNNEFIRRGIEVECAYQESPVYVLADESQLKQALLNIFLNSIDSMQQGAGKLCIRTKNLGDYLDVEIKDTGCGIPEQDLPKIFDPFYSTKELGVGLGLSIVDGIIKEHKGTIEVKSKPGQGSSFIIRLPCVFH